MEIRGGRSLWAPNVWAACEVYDASLLVEPADDESGLPQVVERLDSLLPQRARMFGPFLPALEHAEDGAYLDWPRLVAEIALVLQSEARPPEARFLRVLGTCETRLFRVAFEARDPVLARDCLVEAVRLINTARTAPPEGIPELLEQLVDRADRVCLGPSTMLIVRAALARGIPYRRMSELSLVQFGQGVRQRRIWTAETDRTPAIAEAISRNKQLTKRLLAAAGVPVPQGRVVDSAEEAWEAAVAVGLPVVVKPLDGNHGRGVFLNLQSREEVLRAFAIAQTEGREVTSVIVEQFVTGVEHRLLVVGSRVVACAQGEYLYVEGDGRQTIAELIATQINGDARRGRSETLPNDTVEIDSTVLAQLEQEGCTEATVPVVGRQVLVKRIGSHGPDVTSSVHPEVAAAAVRAARTVGLDVAGIDLVAEDISQPLAGQGAMVCEVNAGPQLLIHAFPKTGPSQPVGEAIVEQLFAPGETGRIPFTAILGQHGDRVARLLERVLRAAGRCPALTCAAGKWVAGWPAGQQSHATSEAARDVLMSPEVDCAVSELDWRSISRQGAPTDRITLLVLLAPGEADPVEPADVDRVDSALAVATMMMRTVDPAGAIVVLGEQHDLVERARASGRGLIEVVGHEATGAAGSGRRVAVRHQEIVYLDGDEATPVLSLAAAIRALPPGGVVGGGVVDRGVVDRGVVDHSALLNAVAAAIGLGIPVETIRSALTD
jgi:cyanophycin synthetase